MLTVIEKVAGIYCSQKQNMNSSMKHQFNVKRERVETEVAKHLIFDNCFMMEILNDLQ